MQKRILITVSTIVGAIYMLGYAFSFTLNFTDINTQSLESKFSIVHFTAPGNNFLGSILRLPTKSISPITINLGTHHKTCTKQIRGLYFNSQRGKRIRPLDTDSLQLLRDQNTGYNNLEVSGGLYTTCDSGSNYGIFGAITYVRGGITSHIVAGTRIDYPNNKILPFMANSFQYFDNKFPIGYIYDSNGGIGFVGGTLSGHENLIEFLNGGGTIQSGFTYSGGNIIANNTGRETTIESGNSAMETLWNLIIQGSVGLSKAIQEEERLSFLGNISEKTVVYNGSDINSSTIINFAKQKAKALCKGQETYQSPTLASQSENTICVENHDLTIDLSNTNVYQNKTIIVKSGNVILQNGMNDTSPPLDILIDKGILYLPNTITAIGFNEEGFPSTLGVNSGLYLKGNFIVNGLLLGEGTGGFNHKLHLQGKVTLLNTPTLPTAERKTQINELFETSAYENFINLQNVFTRTCGLNGIGSDGSSCISNKIISTIPLVILNGNYPSSLLQ